MNLRDLKDEPLLAALLFIRRVEAISVYELVDQFRIEDKVPRIVSTR